MTDTTKLAAEFSRRVRRDLAEHLPEIRRRNAASEYGCATHDFCDANEIMGEAFKAVMGRNILPDDDSEPTESDCDLRNAAWEIARKAEFR